MKLFEKKPKGEINNYYPTGVVIIVVGLIFCIWYYNYHQNDVVIHAPHIEVH